MTGEISTVETAPREGIKETIESIVVALILAFIFRAFVVEAFVIPTGSMAPTLYGAHGTIACESCGKEFAYGLRDLGDSRHASSVGSRSRAYCPNCHHGNTGLKTNDEKRNPETGDRILVLKWPFDIGVESLRPARWDVTVFKDPSDGTTNFIKRLVGLPNEVLAIIDGDVYTVPTSELSEKTRTELEQIRHEKYLYRTRRRKGVLRSPSRIALHELDAKMAIARKVPEAQEALWFLVYDHDYPPKTQNRGQPYWRAGADEKSGWDASTRRVRFENKRQPNDFIELVGKQILASNAYNIPNHAAPYVADQRVRFVMTPAGDQGTIGIQLEKLGRIFRASIDVSGKLSITERNSQKRNSRLINLEGQLPPFTAGESFEVSFENVDYRLALRIAGREVLATSLDRGSQDYYGPALSQMRSKPLRGRKSSPPRIDGSGGDFELIHLVVERDTYYYHEGRRHSLGSLPWAPKAGWACAEHPLLLRGHEYFMLGDNTAASKDSRLWDQTGSHLVARGEEFQLGTVPGDQLIGKAFFVYWPSPNRIDWLDWIPILKGSVVPDVGRMRWIR